jgi:hypothetical protein
MQRLKTADSRAVPNAYDAAESYGSLYKHLIYSILEGLRTVPSSPPG